MALTSAAQDQPVSKMVEMLEEKREKDKNSGGEAAEYETNNQITYSAQSEVKSVVRSLVLPHGEQDYFFPQKQDNASNRYVTFKIHLSQIINCI